jgi:hypothetical protein
MRIIRKIKNYCLKYGRSKTSGLILLLLPFSLLLTTCELDNLNLSCDNCWDIKPTEGILAIDLSPFNNGDSIPVTVYKGKLESGTLFLKDTIVKDYLDVWVPVDNFYTVVAEYKIDSTIIRAVDGDRVSIYLDETNCSVACWRARDGKVDCKLK